MANELRLEITFDDNYFGDEHKMNVLTDDILKSMRELGIKAKLEFRLAIDADWENV